VYNAYREEEGEKEVGDPDRPGRREEGNTEKKPERGRGGFVFIREAGICPLRGQRKKKRVTPLREKKKKKKGNPHRSFSGGEGGRSLKKTREEEGKEYSLLLEEGGRETLHRSTMGKKGEKKEAFPVLTDIRKDRLER